MRLRNIIKYSVVSYALFNFNMTTQAFSLNDAAHQAVSTNPDVLATIDAYNAAVDDINQARAGYFPTIDLLAGIGHEQTDSPGTRATDDNITDLTRKEFTLSLRQLIFDGFAVRHTVDSNVASAYSAFYQVQSVVEDISLEATEAYIDLIRRQKLLELAQQNLTTHQRIYDQIESRSNLGVGLKSELSQVSGRLALAQSNVAAATGNLHNAQTNYLKVVGQLPAESLDEVANQSGALSETAKQAIQLGIQSNPDMKSRNKDVESAQADYGVTKSTYYPQINLEVDKAYQDDIGGVRGRDERFTAMVRLRYNLYRGGADQAAQKNAVNLIEQAKNLRAQTHQNISQDIGLNWNGLKTVQTQLPYLQLHVDSSEATLAAYRKQFSLGKRTLLDVLDSENESFQAKQALVNANYDHVLFEHRIIGGQGRLAKILESQARITAPE